MAGIFSVMDKIKDTASCLNFLRQKNLIYTEKQCGQCNVPCILIKHHCRDTQMWRCPDCLKKLSIRADSFFSKSNLELRSIVLVIYFFSCGSSVKETVIHLTGNVSKKSIIQWYSYLREICSAYLINHSPRLGGVGHIVEVDESLFGRKRKYNVGNNIAYGGPWVFGLIERGRNMCFMFIVDDRKRDTIFPYILRHVLPGTEIHSDEALIYNALPANGFIHRTVCHKTNFVSPVDGAHTNTIESLWSHAKTHLRGLHGTRKSALPLHLDEFMYRWNRLKVTGAPATGSLFDILLVDIAEVHML